MDLACSESLQNWQSHFIEMLANEISVRELARFLVDTRNQIAQQGHHSALVSQLCKNLSQSLSKMGLSLPQLFFQALMREITSYESEHFTGGHFASYPLCFSSTHFEFSRIYVC